MQINDLTSIIRYDNGSVYVGEIQNGEPHGNGTKTYTHLTISKNVSNTQTITYSGSFSRGRESSGFLKYENGTLLKGFFKVCEFASVRFPNGDIYMGPVKGTLPAFKAEGPGILMRKEVTYIGQFSYDLIGEEIRWILSSMHWIKISK